MQVKHDPCFMQHNLEIIASFIKIGSYMSVHVLLNLLNELGKRDKMRGLHVVRDTFIKFNNTRA